MQIDLTSIEEYVSSHLRLFIITVAGLVIFVGIIALSIFFIFVRGEEKTMVPDVRGKELTEAMLALQVKELYPRLQLRYSQSSHDKGLILEQDPKPGSIVKAGRRVRLVVSQGVVLNKIERFRGRNVDEVRMDLQTIYTNAGGIPLLTIKEPIMYDYSEEKPGTILAQKPEAGTDISGPMVIEFVVSMGRENNIVTVPQLTGLNISNALERISSSGINFLFTVRDKNGDEKGETVVSQRPQANSSVASNSLVELTLTYPDRVAENEVFGLFRYAIQPNPYPLAVRLDALLPSGERIKLLSTNYQGGEFTVPYKLPRGTILVLSMLNRELYRETVGS